MHLFPTVMFPLVTSMKYSMSFSGKSTQTQDTRQVGVQSPKFIKLADVKHGQAVREANKPGGYRQKSQMKTVLESNGN